MMNYNLQVMIKRRLMIIQDKKVNAKINRKKIAGTTLTLLMLLAQIELMLLVQMPELKVISTFNFLRNHEDNDEMADMNNLDTTIQVSPTLTIRIRKHHPLNQVIRDVQSAIQTRNMSKNLVEN
nr:hypothetical protein [Tanacetum cinerariifolium]